MKFLNFGSLNIDYTYRVQDFVKGGETIHADTMQKNIGGKGLNQSIALARAGAAVYHAGCVGADGAFLVDYLKENGVETRYIAEKDAPTGHAIIQIDQNGQNCIIIHGGANVQITAEHIDAVLANFDKGDAILLQNEINNSRYIVEKAHEKGLTVIVNPSPVTHLDMPLDKVDYFLLNEHEAAALFGESDVDAVLNIMRTQYPQAKFILTLGADGAVYTDAATTVRAAAVPTEVKDTTAAGDTFTGYVLHALFTGADPESALQLAAKASSIAVSRHGAAQTIPYAHELV